VSSYDLHTHSRVSDGTYTPTELIERAKAVGITNLALSDHDSTAGLLEAQTAALQVGIRLIPAVEISTTWQDKSVHIVGLNINPHCETLLQGLSTLQTTRLERAKEIDRRLTAYGVPDSYEMTRAMAGEGMITRTHFARYLADLGLAASVKEVFDRFLTYGKPGYVPTQWADLEKAVYWIKAAGGIAVLAHPQRYKLSGTKMRQLISKFKDCGGTGLEVVCGTGSPGDIQSSTEYARRFELLASCGSDFHGPEFLWPKLGKLPPLPARLTPVWTIWEAH
jgi:predicted metal-dependent phosphoesterase TrpH